MERLRQADLRAALDFLETIGGAEDLDEFAEALSSRLGAVIPADVVAYNEVDPALGRAFIVADLDVEGELPGATAILERHMGENPIVAYNARTGDGSARTWSDFVTLPRLRATALWNGLFRPFGIRRQMVAVLPTPPPLLVGIVLNRQGRDFSARERTLLDVLRPQLANAYRNAQARATLAALEAGTEPDGDALVVLGKLGEPLALSERARELLAAFGPGGEDLARWSRRARRQAPWPAGPLLARDGDLAVEARLLAPSVVRLRAVHATETLRSATLTPRERDVLRFVAEGLTNKEIAARLDVRPTTVKKHLERTYGKLGVHTRTAAAAAFRAEAPAAGDAR
jgi:DNA-binding CsgD family transcriptional regulator